MNRLPLIEKIHFLESRLGARWSHTTLEPFAFDSSNPIKVQEAGKRIAQHIGLPGLTFVIAYAKQKTNVGGHINLDDKNDVFIEIDPQFKHDYDIVLSVLAHEICHKYLHINNLKLFPELENEMLTDAATIFTGLGKLSLNGCEKNSVSTNTSGTTTTTTTTTYKVGYMNRMQFAFIYRLMCEMRRIPSDVMFRNLTPEATAAVKSISNTDKHFFNSNYFNTDFMATKISNDMKSGVEDAQKRFARLNKNIRIIQEQLVASAHQVYAEFHATVKSKSDAINSSLNKKFDKEAHNYIKNLLAQEEVNSFKQNLQRKETQLRALEKAIPKFLGQTLFNSAWHSGKPNLDFLYQFECPSCNNSLRISEKKLAKVKCPRCSYSFIVDTGLEDFTEVMESVEGLEKKKSSVWAKIIHLFRN